MESTPAADPSPARPNPAQGLGRFRSFARPLVITGTVVAIVSGILLIVVLGLDGFTAAVYSVGGKDINDPTAEAQALREQYAGAKTASIVGLVVGLVVLAAGAVLVYFTRGQETDDDEDLGYDDLAGE